MASINYEEIKLKWFIRPLFRAKRVSNVCRMITSFRFAQNWKDYNLVWNKSEYGDVDSVRIHPRRLWTPDLLMYNR